MAEFKGVNASVASNVNGALKINSGEHVGRVRCLFDTIDLAAGIADTSTILFGAKLPAGARVIEATLSSPVDLAGTGTIDLGWAATVTDVLDADGFIAAADTSGQVAKVQMQAGRPGLLKKFESETQVYATVNGAVAAGAGKKLDVCIEYVID